VPVEAIVTGIVQEGALENLVEAHPVEGAVLEQETIQPH
jgi:hypothetical protein